MLRSGGDRAQRHRPGAWRGQLTTTLELFAREAARRKKAGADLVALQDLLSQPGAQLGELRPAD